MKMNKKDKEYFAKRKKYMKMMSKNTELSNSLGDKNKKIEKRLDKLTDLYYNNKKVKK